ncbi:hypothetical protein MIND_01310900 [Mycena indigotica]|uniref:F-box domain-containing protein n=1 Tax=Mycena indigotica TaxID=2126181 RepID=A0A8H6VUM3_9AGAR|nr:uncharacterized protein MIND_01310900 [Mycena indigotica]KAF7290703.1 hypothetical protein MIND_01310900 [Mycena indigotica]
MGSVELPEDVWRYVAAFIPNNHLITLISVNGPLFNIALDEIYRVVRWEKLDRYFLRDLERLRLPFLAARVRKLHIRGWFIEYLIQRDELLRLSNQVLTCKKSPPTFSASGNASAREILVAMTEAMQLMTGVIDYTFEWRDLSLTRESACLLKVGRATFGNLRRLSFFAQMKNYGRFMVDIDFPALEELQVSFDYDADNTCIAVNAYILQSLVAPFVNTHARSLNILRVSSLANDDLAPLFRTLVLFPRLLVLGVELPFDNTHLADVVFECFKAHTQGLRVFTASRFGTGIFWPRFSERCRP